MLPLFAQFRGKPTWVVTGTAKLPANGNNIEVTTYSDGDVLFWAPDANVQIELKHSDVERLKKLLNNMKAPIPSTRLPEVVKAPVVSAFDVVPRAPVTQHTIKDDEVPSIAQAQKKPVYRTIQVEHEVELHPDLIKPSFKEKIVTFSERVVEVQAPMTLAEAKLVYATKDAPDADKELVNQARKILRKDALSPIYTEKAILESHVPAPTVAKETIAKSPSKIERSVKKEDKGWGSNVNIGGKPVRYYYNYREPARNSAASHKVGGPEGRVA